MSKSRNLMAALLTSQGALRAPGFRVKEYECKDMG